MHNIAKIIAALGLVAGLTADLTWSDSAMARGGGFHGGGFRGGGFRGGGWGLGLGYGLYGYPYGYGYPYDYGYYPYYGVPAAPYDYPPGVAYGPYSPGPGVPQSHRVSAYCATSARICVLRRPGYVGAPCSCRVAGGLARGRIAPQ
jgi:hypothetical protein